MISLEDRKHTETVDSCCLNSNGKKISVSIFKTGAWEKFPSEYSDRIFSFVQFYLTQLKHENLFSGSLIIGNFGYSNPKCIQANIKGFGKISLAREIRYDHSFAMLFELAHELTHYFADQSERTENTWIEESICTLASYVISMNYASRLKGYGNPEPYGNDYFFFCSIIQERLQEIILSTPEYISGGNPLLSHPSSKVSRSHQAEFVKAFLPYFRRENGDIWHIVQHLPRQCYSVSDQDFFDHWIQNREADKTDRHVRKIRDFQEKNYNR